MGRARNPRTTTASSPGKELPRDERRAELVKAAYAVLGEKGFEGLRTRDIAARAGMNISTLHYYFGTKDALLLGVIEHVRDTFVQREPRAVGRETLRAHIASAWKTFQTNPQLAIVLQELVMRAHRDPASRNALRTLHAFWNRMVEHVLRGAIEAGEIRSDVDPAAGARIVTSFIMGATAQLGVNPKAFDFADVARELERWADANVSDPK